MIHRLIAQGARAAVAALALSASIDASAADVAGQKLGVTKHKHVILMIGDGMHKEHEVATSRFLTGTDDGLAFSDPAVMQRGALVTTWDVSTYNAYASLAGKPAFDAASFDPLLGYDPARGGAAPSPLDPSGEGGYLNLKATDSASAGTALSTGRKTVDGNIAWLPGDLAGGALTTIAEEVRERLGFAIGVVSTVPFSHATPAAFVSHNVSRNNYGQIAREIIGGVRPEVVIGGGHPDFNDATPTGARRNQYIDEADYQLLRGGTAGYTLVERATGVDGGAALLAAAGAAGPGEKLFGLFGGQGGNFESPVPTRDGSGVVGDATQENPSLAEASVAALEVLSRDPDGLFVMIEQGDIDWANHANDYPRMIGTVYDLDRAVRAVIEYVNRPGDAMNWANTLLIVTSDHGNSYMRINGELPRGVIPEKDGSCAALPAAVPAYTACLGSGLVTYQSGGHTNELVTAYAKGVHASKLVGAAEAQGWYPGTPLLDNTQLHGLMRRAVGLE